MGVPRPGFAGARHGPRPLRRLPGGTRPLRPRRRGPRPPDLEQLCFEGPADELSQTFNSQPAIFVTSLACLDRRARARRRAADAGVRLRPQPRRVHGARRRRRARASRTGCASSRRAAGSRRPPPTPRPAAWPRSSASTRRRREAVCDEAGAELCNINSPGQIVIGGAEGRRREGLRARARARREARHPARRQRRVPHVADAAGRRRVPRGAVAATPTSPQPRIPVVANDTAPPMHRAGAPFATELAYQLTHPVRWVQCVEYMAAQRRHRRSSRSARAACSPA